MKHKMNKHSRSKKLNLKNSQTVKIVIQKILAKYTTSPNQFKLTWRMMNLKSTEIDVQKAIRNLKFSEKVDVQSFGWVKI